MDAIDKILQLLTLIEKQATVVPHLKHLSVAALNELTKMNDDAAKAHAEKTAADAKKAADAEAKKASAAVRPMGEPAQKASDVSKDKLSI